MLKLSIQLQLKQLTPEGYKLHKTTWTPHDVEPNHILHIPLDARGKEFIRIKLTEEPNDA